MTPEQLFSIVNPLALIGWLGLIALPRQRWVTDIVTGMFLPAVFAVIYIVLIVPRFMSSDGGFSSLGGVSALFANPWILLAGWIHYLAFDLLIGTWEVRDAQSRGISHLFVIPCLGLTFMFGPAGWLVYLGVRTLLPSRTPTGLKG